jgi:hypothetical protein
MTWEDLFNDIAVRPNVRFSELLPDVLQIAAEVNHLWTHGLLAEGEYRQKGTRWNRLLREIIVARTGVSVGERTLAGLTGLHRVDLAPLGEMSPAFAGEVKVLGTLAHLTKAGEQRLARGGSTDLEKRLKEVKHTAVDLKLYYSGTTVGEWGDWIARATPPFYSFWVFLLTPHDNLMAMLAKLRALRAYYHNGVGALFFESTTEGYVPLSNSDLTAFDIDNVIDEVVGLIR